MITKPLAVAPTVEALPPCTVCGEEQRAGTGDANAAYIVCRHCKDSRPLGPCPVCRHALVWDETAERFGQVRLICDLGHRYRVEYGETIVLEGEDENDGQ